MSSNHPDITEKVIDGGGLFDELMTTITLHLDKEYKASRLRGPDYAKVYLGSIEAMLAQTVEYLKHFAFYDLQEQKLKAEISLVEAQADKVWQEAALIPLEKDKLEAEIRLIEAQIRKLDREDQLIAKQIEKLTWDSAVAEWQVYDIQANIRDENLGLSYNRSSETISPNGNNPFIRGVKHMQRKLTEHKALTEQAQFSDRIVWWNEDGTTKYTRDVQGLVAGQSEVYKRQADGLKNRSENEALKALTDMWMVGMTTGDLDVPKAGTDNDISTVLVKYIENVYGSKLVDK